MSEHRKIGTRYSKFEDKTIRDMLEDGKSPLEIAKTLNRPVGGVEKHISEFKLHKNTSRAAGNVRFEEITRILDLYLQDKGIMAIVDETKRSDRTIKRITFIVDYLLANGFIRLPCMVGADVWHIKDSQDGKGTKTVHCDKVKQISINSHGMFLVIDYCQVLACEDLGKTVFLTREEAEKALKEIDENA